MTGDNPREGAARTSPEPAGPAQQPPRVTNPTDAIEAAPDRPAEPPTRSQPDRPAGR